MFKNYFKTAWRNIIRHKSLALINISGLTLGIACSLLLFLMVSHFSSFDKHHSKRDRIYRVVNQSDGNNGTNYQAGIPSVLPDAFRGDFPEAEQVVFTSYRAGSLILVPQKNTESKKFQENYGVVFTEPSFFKIFDRKVVQGDALNGIDEPNEAIISQSWAKRYFGSEDAIGEVVKYNEHEYKITAIMEDAPDNTDFPFELMLSYATIKKETEANGWGSIWSDEQCYFLLKDGEPIEKLETQLPAFAKKYLGENDFDHTQFLFQPLSEVHYDERFGAYSYNTVPRAMLIAFGVLAFVLVVTACINFINLATAEAIKRSKEVGVRKSLGSSRGQLIRQFLGETTFITLVSVFASVAVAQVALSFLNPFLELKLSMDFTSNPTLWIYLLSITAIVSLLSGLYPAFVISGFNPVVVLKNQLGNKNSSSYFLRRALVVVQFAISQLLVIITIVVIYQMKYSSEKDLGFAKDAILITDLPQNAAGTPEQKASKIRTLREQMLAVTGVQNATLCYTAPSSGSVSATQFTIEGIADPMSTQVKPIDGNYIDVFELKVLSGKNLKDSDTISGFLVNEKLAHTAGYTNAEDMVGKEIELWRKKFPVVGVVQDFHTMSLRSPIEPTALFNRASNYRTLAIKVEMAKSQQVIAELKSKWEAAYPEDIFEFEFLDENIKSFYDGERRMSILMTVFTSMAIFIGCLGLFGLATFMANQKTKEIGVRKVLGASVESILLIFSKEFILLIFIGFVLAAPLGWLAMSAFLDQFQYKIDLTPGIFLTGFGLTLVIAMLTVGYRSFRAAIRNPVTSLRYE
jgi:putative ABC transport system permease protein